MRARAQQAGLRFDAPYRAHQQLEALGIVEPVVERARLGGDAHRPLDGHERVDAEAGRLELGRDLLRVVEVGRREPVRVLLLVGVAVLAIGHVALDDGLEARLQQ